MQIDKEKLYSSLIIKIQLDEEKLYNFLINLKGIGDSLARMFIESLKKGYSLELKRSLYLIIHALVRAKTEPYYTLYLEHPASAEAEKKFLEDLAAETGLDKDELFKLFGFSEPVYRQPTYKTGKIWEEIARDIEQSAEFKRYYDELMKLPKENLAKFAAFYLASINYFRRLLEIFHSQMKK